MSFKKNPSLEKRLKELSELLRPVEQKILDRHKPSYSLPLVLLIGSPRSGSTLFMQWAASLSVFSTPTNFLSRFFYAPYIGALISEMLTNSEYAYRNEFADINTIASFSSETGKTQGFNAPHEFWYFWRQFFNFSDIPADEQDFISTADFDLFNKETSLLQRALGRILIMKGHICSPYLESFAKNIKNGVYLHLHRDPVSNIRSLLNARLIWNKSATSWFSAKPREYHAIKNMDIYHQVAGQVYFKEKQILDKRHALENRYIHFTYEDFCNNPEDIYIRCTELINKHIQHVGETIITKYNGPVSFTKSSLNTDFDDDKIEAAYKYFEKRHGILDY